MRQDPHPRNGELHVWLKVQVKWALHAPRIIMHHPRTWHTKPPAVPLLSLLYLQTKCLGHLLIHNGLVGAGVHNGYANAVVDGDGDKVLGDVSAEEVADVHHTRCPRRGHRQATGCRRGLGSLVSSHTAKKLEELLSLCLVPLQPCCDGVLSLRHHRVAVSRCFLRRSHSMFGRRWGNLETWAVAIQP